MKRKRLLIIIAAALVGAACLAFGAVVARRYLVPAVSPPVDTVRDLYSQKHPYIGRLPSNLLALLARHKDLYGYGQGLETVNRPYGYQRWYGADYETYEQYRDDPENQRVFQKNALIIMALIENCDFVEYGVRWDNKEIAESDYPRGTKFRDMGQGGITFKYTKEWADGAINGDIKQQAETEDDFRAFLNAIGQIDLPPAQE